MPRPKEKDSATKQKILDSAKELFSKNGYAATAISEIASNAKINQSLIYHHFENKQSLWREVKKYFFTMPTAPSLESIKTEISQMHSLDDLIDWFIDRRTIHLDENPQLLNILQWQFAERDALSLSNYQRFNPILREKINELQQQGKICEKYKTDFIAMLLIMLPAMSLTAPNIFGLKPAANTAEMIAQIRELLKKGLA